MQNNSWVGYGQGNNSPMGRPYVSGTVHSVNSRKRQFPAFAWLVFGCGGEISAQALDWFRRPQLRWGSDGAGKLIHSTDLELELDPEIVKALGGGHLEEFESLLTQKQNVMSLSTEIMEEMGVQSQDADTAHHWTSEALKVLSFVFPVDQFLEREYGRYRLMFERNGDSLDKQLRRFKTHQSSATFTDCLPGYGDRGRELLPSLRRTLDKALTHNANSLPSEDVVKALVSATRFGTLEDRLHILAALERLGIESRGGYLSLLFARRKSGLLRLSGDIPGSQTLINDTLFRTAKPGRTIANDTRCNAERGFLYLSMAENFQIVGKYQDSEHWANTWAHEEVTSLSTLELLVIRDKHALLVKIMHYKGNFEGAMDVLKMCGITVAGDDTAKANIVNHEAEVLCELGEPRNALQVLEEHQPYFANAKRPQAIESKGWRRLELCRIMALTQLESFEDAKEHANRLAGFYKPTQNLDLIDEFIRLRLKIYQAIILHLTIDSRKNDARWDEAVILWENVHTEMGSSKAFGSGGFDNSVVFLWFTHATLKQNGEIGDRASFDEARRITSEAKEYDIVGFGTHWLSRILSLYSGEYDLQNKDGDDERVQKAASDEQTATGDRLEDYNDKDVEVENKGEEEESDERDEEEGGEEGRGEKLEFSFEFGDEHVAMVDGEGDVAMAEDEEEESDERDEEEGGEEGRGERLEFSFEFGDEHVAMVEDGEGDVAMAENDVSENAGNVEGDEGLKSAEPYFEVERLSLRKRKKQKPGRRRATASASKVQEQQKSSNYRIMLTEAARAKGILEWEKLLKLDNVSYEGGEYRPGDNVYICTTEPGGPPASDPAQIVEIRQTGDERRRKDICVAWLYSRDQLANKKGANWTEMWRMGASHVVSNSYQILPWDTINSAAKRHDVRTSDSFRMDVFDSKFPLFPCVDAAVRWVDEESEQCQRSASS